MSDLLIKGIDLPTDDIVSLIAVFSGGDVKFIDRTTFSTFYIPQKAIEVPSHGRLIDADLAINNLDKYYCKECDNWNGVRCKTCDHYWAMQVLEDSPTVLEASE